MNCLGIFLSDIFVTQVWSFACADIPYTTVEVDNVGRYGKKHNLSMTLCFSDNTTDCTLFQILGVHGHILLQPGSRSPGYAYRTVVTFHLKKSIKILTCSNHNDQLSSLIQNNIYVGLDQEMNRKCFGLTSVGITKNNLNPYCLAVSVTLYSVIYWCRTNEECVIYQNVRVLRRINY